MRSCGIIGAVADFFFRDFLSRFDSKGLFACACGQTHRIATRWVLVEQGAIESSEDLLHRVYGPEVAMWILSDENTERAAGRRWKGAVRAARIVSNILPAHPKPVPTAALVDRLAEEARSARPDLLVSVGSGVISDLVKKISLDLSVPNWCVATAASVDAYSSATSALRIEGSHKPVPARVSEAIVCDLGVIAEAPKELFLAGLGDLLAKFISYLDWNVSRLVTGERYCAVVSDIARDSARAALSAARGWREGAVEASRTLIDAALTSGFVMQATGGSRAAASAEHTIAHFWEMAALARNERLDLHGILVGAASRIVMLAYDALFHALEDREPAIDSRLKDFAHEAPWRDMLEEGVRPFIGRIQEEMAGRLFDGDVLRKRLLAFTRRRTEILRLSVPVLDELALAVELLQRTGFPFSLSELGISPSGCLLACRNVRLLRNRYSSFDLAYELGLESLMLDVISRTAGAECPA